MWYLIGSTLHASAEDEKSLAYNQVHLGTNTFNPCYTEDLARLEYGYAAHARSLKQSQISILNFEICCFSCQARSKAVPLAAFEGIGKALSVQPR